MEDKNKTNKWLAGMAPFDLNASTLTPGGTSQSQWFNVDDHDELRGMVVYHLISIVQEIWVDDYFVFLIESRCAQAS